MPRFPYGIEEDLDVLDQLLPAERRLAGENSKHTIAFRGARTEVWTMPQNTDRILPTHVGSLIRPPKLIEFWRAIEGGKPYDEAAFEACLTETVAEVVRQQAEAGMTSSATASSARAPTGR